jgi:hypothetical protein
MTCSFHKFGEYFPGTGTQEDRGRGKGKGYAVNVPLKDGITDEAFKGVFEPVRDILLCIFLCRHSMFSFKGHREDSGGLPTFSCCSSVWGGFTSRRQTRLLQPYHAWARELCAIHQKTKRALHSSRWWRVHGQKCCTGVDVRDGLCTWDRERNRPQLALE